MILISTISPFAQNVLSRWYLEKALSNPEEDPVYTEQLSRAETMKSYAHSLQMRPELAIFGLKDWVVREYQKSSNIVAELDQPVQPNSIQNQVYNYVVNFAQTGSRAMMYLLVAMKSDYFGVPLPSLAYLEQSTQSLFNHTWGLYSRMGYVFRDLMDIQELFECMEMQPAVNAPEMPAEYESPQDRHDKGMKIEFKNVSFKYPEQCEFVLKDVSFVLEAGETLALLGFNGSGMYLAS
jgi:ATP-binding cassette, subfamily B, bacterial